MLLLQGTSGFEGKKRVGVARRVWQGTVQRENTPTRSQEAKDRGLGIGNVMGK
jgi:hypothetical protein